MSRGAGLAAGCIFIGLLVALPPLARFDGTLTIAEFNAFYRSDALVFGGGPVILPLLQQQTVVPGWVTQTSFVAGYGAAQAVPGPLSTFATYLGWVSVGVPNRLAGAALATAGVFVPGLLLIVAALPYWHSLRDHPATSGAMAGVNAAVVGLLAMALYSPVWTSSVNSVVDVVAACTALVLLIRWKTPALLVVMFSAFASLTEALLS